MDNFVIQKQRISDTAMLTKEEIEEFKRLVKEVYGIELTNAEAEDQGSRLIQLFELMLKQEMDTKDHSIQVKGKGGTK
jgi:hypothetical protein